VGSHYRDFGLLKTAMDLVWQRRPGARLMAIGTRRENDPNPRFDTDDPRIRFIDGIPDGELVQAYQGARVALCPLAQATATNAMLEAMACGLPIVATDVGGVREYLGTGVGLVSAPARPEEFAANILRVLEDESEALEMSRRSRARALQLDFAVVARAMKGVYDQIESWPSRSQRQLSL
jgi:glycosyltransferase involved in cell wall biosynthesis